MAPFFPLLLSPFRLVLLVHLLVLVDPGGKTDISEYVCYPVSETLQWVTVPKKKIKKNLQLTFHPSNESLPVDEDKYFDTINPANSPVQRLLLCVLSIMFCHQRAGHNWSNSHSVLGIKIAFSTTDKNTVCNSSTHKQPYLYLPWALEVLEHPVVQDHPIINDINQTTYTLISTFPGINHYLEQQPLFGVAIVQAHIIAKRAPGGHTWQL